MINGTGPSKRKAIAIDALPIIEIMVGYLMRSQTLTKTFFNDIFLNIHSGMFRKVVKTSADKMIVHFFDIFSHEFSLFFSQLSCCLDKRATVAALL